MIVRPKIEGYYEIISGHRRKYAAEKLVQNILSSNAFSILFDILAEEIQISFLEELHRIDAVKLRKDIVPQVAAAYYSGGIIQILRYWVTSRDSLSEELLVKQYSILLGMFLTPAVYKLKVV